MISIRAAVILFGFVGAMLAVNTSDADYASTVLDDNPIAYYRFEEAAGATVVADSSGAGLDSLEMTNALLGVPGLIGTVVEFGGDGNVVVGVQMDPADPEGDGVGVGLDDFSVEMWVQIKQDTGAEQVFAAQQNGTGLGRSNMITTNQGGVLGSFIGGATSNSTVFPELDLWYHFVMTYDGANGDDALRFYVNGEFSGAVTRAVEAATGNWVIGSHKGQAIQFTAGLLDEVAFYDFRLDDPDGDDDVLDSRILTHFDARFPGGPGDANQDGVVDFLDFEVIRDHFQADVASGMDGDVDLNGIVEIADFRIWKDEFERMMVPPANVPEPASLVLAIMCGVMACATRAVSRGRASQRRAAGTF